MAKVWRRVFSGMLVRRECWTLSRKAKLIILVLGMGGVVASIRFIYPFLAVTKPAKSEIMIVESWVPRYALRESVALYQKGGYTRVFTSGCQKTDDLGGTNKISSAEPALIQMERFGLSQGSGAAISCWVERKDRTYNSALTVKAWFEKNGIKAESVDLVTLGPHARRSRLLYQKAFGSNIKVGVIAIEDRNYDSDRWWRSSEGVRDVVGETVAYIYARVFFHPSDSNLSDNSQSDPNSFTNGPVSPASADVRTGTATN